MIDVRNQPNISNIKKSWQNLRNKVRQISQQSLQTIGFERFYFYVQCKNPDLCHGNSRFCELCTKKSTISKENFKSRIVSESMKPKSSITTWTHSQGKDEFCWLYSIATSIHKTLLIKADSLPNESEDEQAIKEEANDFLSRKNEYKNFWNFHQTLRHEILFALVPRTFESDIIQGAALKEVAQLLTVKRFLHDQGLNQLGTIIKFSEIIKQPLDFEYTLSTLDDFLSNVLLDSSNQYWPATLLDTGKHVGCITGYTKTPNGYTLKIRDSAMKKDADEKTTFTIDYPSQNQTRLYIDPTPEKAVCLYFTIV